MEIHSTGGEVRIPNKEYEGFRSYIKDKLSREKDTNTRKGRPYLKLLKILNDSSSIQVTSFAEILQNDLIQKHDIIASITETWKEVQSDEIIVLICNRNQSGSIGQAAKQCLQDVERDLFKRIILIVLHVTRQDKLPKLSSRGELQIHKDYSKVGCVVDMGFQDGNIYSCPMNEKAFTDIINFCLEYGSVYNDSDRQLDAEHCASSDGRNIMQQTNNCQSVTGSLRKTVYVFNPTNTEACKNFIETFQDRMKELGILLSEKQIKDAKDLDPEPFAILVCNASSRILSDIKACLCQTIRELRNRTILLVLHVTRKGKEPKESTRTKLDSDCLEKYSFLHSIIDMAFTVEDGLYDCSMNEKAFAGFKIIYDELVTHL